MPDKIYRDKIYPDKLYRTKYTGQDVPGKNIPGNIYRTKCTGQNILDKIYQTKYTQKKNIPGTRYTRQTILDKMYWTKYTRTKYTWTKYIGQNIPDKIRGIHQISYVWLCYQMVYYSRESGICHRITPLRMLYIVTLTYIFKVTNSEMWISRKRWELAKTAQVWLL